MAEPHGHARCHARRDVGPRMRMLAIAGGFGAIAQRSQGFIPTPGNIGAIRHLGDAQALAPISMSTVDAFQPSAARYAARCCVASAALLSVAIASRIRARRQAKSKSFEVVEPEEMKLGRCIRLNMNVSQSLSLKGSSDSMDAFMQENATEVCLQNVQRIEDKSDDTEVKFLYLEPTDFGPYRSQMRLTVKVEAGSGRCDINILNMEAGVIDKKTGDVDFNTEAKMSFKTENTVSWKDAGNGKLRVMNRSQASSMTSLPWWFPVPDAAVEKIAQFFIGQVISTGVKKVNEQIEQRYASWLAKS